MVGGVKKTILVAGLGNIFLADDGFGCETVKALENMTWPDSVEIRDFGIRAYDLALEMTKDYQAILFIDAVQRGKAPGSLTVIEPEIPTHGDEISPFELAGHNMNPYRVLKLAKLWGAAFPPLLIIGCEAQSIPEPEDDQKIGLSPEVGAAIGEATRLVRELVFAVLKEGTWNARVGDCP